MRTGQLGLSVRERGAARQTQVPLNARAVSAWLDALPIANIGESSRQVYQFLVDINGAPLEVSERLKIMQALTKVVSHITDALRKHYIGQSVSLNEKQRKIAALAQAMQSEMAIGYKTVVEDMLGEGHQRYNAQVLVPALYYAVHYLSLVLLRCYQLYSQQPARLWKELHALYHFAEQNGLHRQTAISDYNELTIEAAYLRIVLTACANPYQLRQREIEQVFDAAATLSAEALLQPYSPGKDLFYLDLDSDLGPQSHSLNQHKPGPHCRSVRLDAVLAKVQDDLRSTSGLMLGVAKNPVQQLGATLLRHLVRAYGNMASRSFSRTAASGTIRVAIGLSASHYLLSGEDRQKPSAALPHEGHDLQTLEGSLRNATLVDDDRQHSRILPGGKKPAGGPTDPWEKLYRVKEGWDASHKPAEVSATSPRNFTENANVSYEFQIAAMINISPGGYCLGLRGNVPVQTQTGEIVGLMEQDEQGELHWNIGTIRWMKRIPDGALHLGIQLIAPNARPVLTQVRNSQTSSTAYQRGLLLPALKGIGQPATLITAPLPYAVKQKVRIKDGDKVYDVQLTKQAAASASYRQFHFSDALSGRDPVDNSNKASDGDNFDSVWELL